MSHLVQFHQEPSVAFSTSRALFTREEHHDGWSTHGWTEVHVTLAEIGPQLYVLMLTALASTLCHSEVPIVRCSLWECSGSGYDEDAHRVWVSPNPDSCIVLSLAEDAEYWALVRLVFESRDIGRRRHDEVERLSQQALTLIPRVVEGSNTDDN